MTRRRCQKTRRGSERCLNRHAASKGGVEGQPGQQGAAPQLLTPELHGSGSQRAALRTRAISRVEEKPQGQQQGSAATPRRQLLAACPPQALGMTCSGASHAASPCDSTG